MNRVEPIGVVNLTQEEIDILAREVENARGSVEAIARNLKMSEKILERTIRTRRWQWFGVGCQLFGLAWQILMLILSHHGGR
jgi:hypothetical protein